MDLYYQEIEVELLLKLFARLSNKLMVDVGAERGGFVEAFLNSGSQKVYAFEPYPHNIAYLQQHFGANPTVQIFQLALGSHDETAMLHIAQNRAGEDYGSYHSLVKFGENAELHWGKDLPVACRSLASLVEQHELPDQVGVLKIDTEGGDYAVVQGMGSFHSDIIMVEYWEDLPELFGPCPWKFSDMAATLAERGYSNFVFIDHHDEFMMVELNLCKLEPGDWGNILFIHNSVYEQLTPVIFKNVVETQSSLVERAKWFRAECRKRDELISEISSEAELTRATAEERLVAINEKDQVIRQLDAHIKELEERLNQDGRLAELAAVAAERLTALHQSNTQLHAVAAEAARCEQGLHELTAVIAARDARLGELEQTAATRLEALEQLETQLGAVAAEAARREQGLHELTAVIAARDVRLGELEQTAATRLEALEQLETQLGAVAAEATVVLAVRDQQITELGQELTVFQARERALAHEISVLKNENLLRFFARRIRGTLHRKTTRGS